MLVTLPVLLLLPLMAAGEEELGLESYVMDEGERLCLTGVISSDAAIYSVHAWVRDDRTMSVERETRLSFDDGVSAVSAAALNARLGAGALTSGEKTLFVAMDEGEGEKEILRACFYVLGSLREPRGIEGQCRVLLGTRTVSELTDGNVSSYADLQRDIQVEFPAGTGEGTLILRWMKPPTQAQAYLYAGSEQREVVSLEAGFYVHHIAFGADITSVRLVSADMAACLGEIAVYPGTEISPVVEMWRAAEPDLDILFIATHQDDEFLFFGGAIPYYAGAGKNIAVAYAVNCGVRRYYEALSALWVAGCKTHPIFLGYPDIACQTQLELAAQWQRHGDLLDDLVSLIRQYRPQVIVTQDDQGEYGHLHHQYLVSLVKKAVGLAADATYETRKTSFAPWQTRKLYCHLSPENSLILDWSQEVPGKGGISAWDLGRVAFRRNETERYFTFEKHGVRYDNRSFGLVFSTVGEDVEKNDFLENIK